MTDATLASYATARQLDYLQAVELHGSNRKAAAALGVNSTAVDRALAALKRKAAKGAPSRVWSHPAPSPHVENGGSKRIFVLPDVQAKPGNDFSFLMRAGQYVVEKQPDVIVCIGDFADMPSLSSYDKGKKAFEGRRYKRDIEAAHEAMSAFLTPLVDYNAAHPRNEYRPRMVLTLGNHEARIDRATNDDPMLAGILSVDDLKYKEFGWEVHPFLEVVMIEGVAFSHYFVTGVAGRPASTAAAQLRKTNISSVAGHQQGKQIAYATRADGSTITSIIAGSFYEHEELYLGPQGNKHWRGCLMMNEVREGAFDEMWLSLDYLNKKYAHIQCAPDYSKVPLPELAPRAI